MPKRSVIEDHLQLVTRMRSLGSTYPEIQKALNDLGTKVGWTSIRSFCNIRGLKRFDADMIRSISLGSSDVKSGDDNQDRKEEPTAAPQTGAERAEAARKLIAERKQKEGKETPQERQERIEKMKQEEKEEQKKKLRGE